MNKTHVVKHSFEKPEQNVITVDYQDNQKKGRQQPTPFLNG